MDEVVVQPWVLRLSLWVVLATFVVLLATIVMARLVRSRRRRVITRELAPVRRDIVAIAAGDDEDGAADARLRALHGHSVELVEPLLVGYLSKVRGAPAQQIVDILVDHGLVRRARAGLSAWSGTRRARSAWVLGVMGVREATSEIVPLLRDRDRGVSVTAARALGMLGDSGCAAALLAAVPPGRRGRGELPVWVVVEALGALGPDSAAVVGAALDSPDASTRTAAAMTIGRAQHLSQRERLRSLVGQERDPAVLAAIADSLGELGDPADVPALADMTAPTLPRSVRLAAARALGAIGDRGAAVALTVLLADEDLRVGELAADALIGLGEGGVEVLREADAAEGPAAAASAHGLAMHSLRHPMARGA